MTRRAPCGATRAPAPPPAARTRVGAAKRPPAATLRAIKLIKAARALLVAGDQHLGSLLRHGIASFAEGPVQFTIPAAGSAWQRWFEPAAAFPNPEATPYTGDFTDAFGNRL